MTVGHGTAKRRRGAVLEAAILAAVLQELGASGYAGMSMDAVAERARVSKASLYRRWSGKSELIVAAVYRILPDADEIPDTGSLRADLLVALGDAAAQLAGPAGAGMRGILSDALGDPGVADELRSRRKGRGDAVMREIVRRARARGELGDGDLSPRVLEVGHAMLRHEFLFGGDVTEEYVTSLVDEVVLPILVVTSPPAP
ncbi:TetR/AcrR family transcriptional regulator [Microbacterium pumilum]|uniref:TetR/AcrR family transcriptional regulator n=1 Tax=Microbacterium pumilum TaxID=344165 RepID=A0ABN2SGS9_9MICO